MVNLNLVPDGDSLARPVVIILAINFTSELELNSNGSVYLQVILFTSLLKEPSGFDEAEMEATERSKEAEIVKFSSLTLLL